jgi:O-antigen/teichoic acid export membrane protein
MSFRARLGLTVLVNFILAGISFGTSILAARLLGAQGRGELTAIWIFPVLLSTLALLGLPEALVFFTARSPERAGRILTTCILTGLMISVPVVVGAYFYLPLLLETQTQGTISYARFFLLFIPINAVTGFFSLTLRGKNDLGYWNLTRVIPPTIWFCLLLINFVFVRSSSAGKLSIHYILWLFISGFFVMFLVIWRVRGSFRPDFRELRPMLKYGIPALFGSMPSLFNLRLDQLVMVGNIIPEQLGLYVTAVGYSGITISVTGALASIIVPDIAGVEDDGEKQQKMVRSFRIGSLIAGGMVVLLAISAAWLIPFFYGKEFSPVTPVAMILCLATGIAGMNAILENGLLGLGYPGFIFIAEICGFVVTVILLTLLLKPWQLYGAAVASLASYGIVMVILILLISKKTRIPIKGLMIPTMNEIRLIFRSE